MIINNTQRKKAGIVSRSKKRTGTPADTKVATGNALNYLLRTSKSLPFAIIACMVFYFAALNFTERKFCGAATEMRSAFHTHQTLTAGLSNCGSIRFGTPMEMVKK